MPTSGGRSGVLALVPSTNQTRILEQGHPGRCTRQFARVHPCQGSRIHSIAPVPHAIKRWGASFEYSSDIRGWLVSRLMCAAPRRCR